jgi:hypothetical protein
VNFEFVQAQLGLKPYSVMVGPMAGKPVQLHFKWARNLSSGPVKFSFHLSRTMKLNSIPPYKSYFDDPNGLLMSM